MASGGTAARSLPERLSTGIAGLDTVLGGGLFEGDLYVIHGLPGTGKTTLANQVSFHQARSGRRVVYATLLGESHDRMLQHLANFAFTDLALLPEPLSYVSAYGALEEQGLSGLLDLIRDTLHESRPSLFVLDGLCVAQERAGSGPDFRKFIYALQGQANLYGCATLFLTNALMPASSPEHTMVDGIVELHDDQIGGRAVRSLSVRKFRGQACLRGRHMFCIEEQGIVVHPRLETLVGRSAAARAIRERVSTGIDALDRMLQGGGLPAGSTTLVAGPSGTGKTTMGLLFLARSTVEAPGLFFGCYEPPDDLRLKAEAVDIDTNALLDTGALRMLWHPPFDSFDDEMAHRLLEEVRRSGARRVFVDGANAFRQAAVFPARLNGLFAALWTKLRAEDATTVCSAETRSVAALPELIRDELLPAADNVILLRLAEHRSRLVRLLSILKVRQSGFDPAVVPFAIGRQGITLQEPLANTEEAVAPGAAALQRGGGGDRTV